MIGPAGQERLLTLARRALEARVRGGDPPPADTAGAASILAGAFVTIHFQGRLRGCLGRLESDSPLEQVVVNLATLVADSDPRFSPVTPDELAAIDIEISVITPEQEIHSIDDIDIGRHGLIVEDRGRRGLLLPQVATEHQFDAKTFVEQTCRKAGLPPDAWRNGARVFAFEALVFRELIT